MRIKYTFLNGKLYANGMNREAAAALLGINERTFARKLSGESEFTLDEAHKLCEALNCHPIERLFETKEHPYSGHKCVRIATVKVEVDSEEAERTIAMLTEKADRLRSTLEQCKAEAGSLSVNTEDSKKSCINGLTVTIGGGTTEQQQK